MRNVSVWDEIVCEQTVDGHMTLRGPITTGQGTERSFSLVVCMCLSRATYGGTTIDFMILLMMRGTPVDSSPHRSSSELV